MLWSQTNDTVYVSFGPDYIVGNGMVSIPVRVANFNTIAGFQFAFEWNDTVNYKINSFLIGNKNSQASIFGNTKTGQISYTASNPGTGVTLNDGDVAFWIRFNTSKKVPPLINHNSNTNFQAEFIKGGIDVEYLPYKFSNTLPVDLAFLSINTHFDSNSNCLQDTADMPLKNVTVTLEKDNKIFSAVSDEIGAFSMVLPEDTYNVSVEKKPAIAWQTCSYPSTITVTKGSTTNLNILIQPNISCPSLEVAISTPRLRRCFENIYTVNYANHGSLKADNAYIEVELDPILTVLTSTKPYTQNGSVYTFQIGDVDIEQSGSFYITVKDDCQKSVLGQLVCAKATIYPNGQCNPLPGPWDKSSVNTKIVCQGDSVLFRIKNEGTGAMSSNSNYTIVEDDMIFKKGVVKLTAGAEEQLSLFASGKSYWLLAEQSLNHPGKSRPRAFLEGCISPKSTQVVSLGKGLQFAQDDEDYYIDIHCQEFVGSYDPNEKYSDPKGYGADHDIEVNTLINYTINFQNTGTDTAFNIVIRDTLATHYDLETFGFVSSSHPVKWFIENNVLIFRFDNILLVDSFKNEKASHGYVNFQIAPKSTTPLLTPLKNRAAIFFDFNPPVITDYSVLRVNKNFLPTATIDLQLQQVSIYPNPVQERLYLNWKNFEPDALLIISDIYGNALIEKRATTDLQYIETMNLSKGVYFLSIQHRNIKTSTKFVKF